MPTRRTTFALLLTMLLAAATSVRAQTPDPKQALNEKLWEAATRRPSSLCSTRART